MTTYVVSAIGIPVFLHYCGGELENINYLVKTTTCCGEEEASMDNDCCKDESIVLKNNSDFTFSNSINFQIAKPFFDLFFSTFHFSNFKFEISQDLYLTHLKAPPPKTQNTLVISTSVLRI